MTTERDIQYSSSEDAADINKSRALRQPNTMMMVWFVRQLHL
jgi:hypothetical protein